MAACAAPMVGGWLLGLVVASTELELSPFLKIVAASASEMPRSFDIFRICLFDSF
jgi:hypothetical protein